MIELSNFVALAGANHTLTIKDDSEGMPTLQVARYGFKTHILAALSYVPVLKNIHAVTEFVNQSKTDNAQALGVFLHALSHAFGEKAAMRAVEKNNIDISGNTPLKGRVIAQLLNDATKLAYVPHTDAVQNLCGFQNLGNTCYANATLKLLISSVGADRLIDHLESFKRTVSTAKGLNDVSRNEKLDAAEKFIILIQASRTEQGPIQNELLAFFSSVQKLDAFRAPNSIHGNAHNFQIVGIQNDAQEFLAKLTDSFDFSSIPGNVLSLKETLVNGSEERPPKGAQAYCHNAMVQNSNATTQSILDSMRQEESVEVRWHEGDSKDTWATKVKNWSVPDLSNFHRFNLHLNALDYTEAGETEKVYLTDAHFMDDVSLVVRDEKTGQNWNVTLEPKEIVIQSGTAQSGHYFMYIKHGDKNWVRHDDSLVAQCSGLRASDQAKLISFSVKDKQPLPAATAIQDTPAIAIEVPRPLP